MGAEPFGVLRKTCRTCLRGALSSYITECVECLKKDKPGDRFPNWTENPDEKTE